MRKRNSSKNRSSRIVAGAIGGMLGGIVMAAALTGVRRMPLLRKISSELDDVPVIGDMADVEDEPTDHLGKRLLLSGVLGGVYGGLRSAFHLPGFLFGPVFGLASFGLSWIGLGPAVERTPGPWNEQSSGVVSRLVTHTVYGSVTDLISERVEGLLS